VILSEHVLHTIRRQVRSLFKETRVTSNELAELLQTQVIKRELLEGDKSESAAKTVKRAVRRRRRASRITENTSASQSTRLSTEAPLSITPGSA
jgi:hypothetical protein